METRNGFGNHRSPPNAGNRDVHPHNRDVEPAVSCRPRDRITFYTPPLRRKHAPTLDQSSSPALRDSAALRQPTYRSTDRGSAFEKVGCRLTTASFREDRACPGRVEQGKADQATLSGEPVGRASCKSLDAPMTSLPGGVRSNTDAGADVSGTAQRRTIGSLSALTVRTNKLRHAHQQRGHAHQQACARSHGNEDATDSGFRSFLASPEMESESAGTDSDSLSEDEKTNRLHEQFIQASRPVVARQLSAGNVDARRGRETTADRGQVKPFASDSGSTKTKRKLGSKQDSKLSLDSKLPYARCDDNNDDHVTSSLGARVLRRARSAMRMPASDRDASPGVQPAADREQASTESPPNRRISATDNCAMRPATTPEPRSPAPPAVVAEGRLYRRGKVTKWNRNWAVLTGDRMLKFYKSENVLSTSGPALQLDLSGGCDVQSIFQGKSCASFTLLLRPNSALHNLRSSEKSPSSPSRARKSTTTTEVRSVQLMCKSTHELVQWMKALVQVHDGRPPLRSLIPIRPQVSSSDSSPEPGVGGTVGAGLESRYDDIEFIDSDSTSDDDDDAIGAKFRARCANDAPLLPSKPKIAQNSNARVVDSPPAAAATIRAPRARRSSGTRQLSPRALTRDDARVKTDATRAVGFIPTTNGARARRQQQQATATAIERNGRDAASSPTTTTSPPRENLPDSRRRIRRLSDGDLLEPIGDLGYRMRDLKQHVIPELTHVDFIEIYGYAIQPAIPSKESNSVEKTERIKLKFFDNVSRTNNRNSSYGDKKKPHTQKLIGRNEQKESPLGRKTRSSTLPGYGKQPARSSSEKKARNDSSSSWFSGVAESFRWKAKPASSRGRSTDRRSDRRSERTVDEARGPQHSGRLELRAKNKRHWNRFWCELRDERLYCYETRQAAAAREVLLLRGYTALAVPDAAHKRAIRLERKGFPTYQLAAETVDERTSWMRALRHHLAPQSGEDGRAATAVERAEATKRDDTSDMSESAKRDDSGDTPNESDSRLADVEKQKQKLLRQLVTEQQKIREELQDLDRKHPSPTCSRDGHVTQASHDEQLIAKRLAHLSRRRNSAQLKCDHLARDMAPPVKSGAGKSRKRLSAPAGGGQAAPRLEEKMCETRQRLARFDAEIERLRMRKKELAASCREREALASQVTDRVSALRSLRDRSRDDLQRSYDSAPDFRTIAIDVASLEERSCSSSSSSSSSPHSARSSEPDGALPRRHNSSDLDAVFSDSVWSVTGSDVTSMTSDDPLAASSPAAMTSASRRRSMMTSSQTSEWSARVAEVDPNVIASIEMFEEFSRKTLARLESNANPGRKSK